MYDAGKWFNEFNNMTVTFMMLNSKTLEAASRNKEKTAIDAKTKEPVTANFLPLKSLVVTHKYCGA